MRTEVASTDLAIVGAGPAGMAAAEFAADSGLDVTVIDEQPAPGGQIYRQPPGEFEARQWLDDAVYRKGTDMLRRVEADERIRWQTASTVAGILSGAQHGADARFVLVVDGGDGLCHLEADAVLIASGCYDMPVLFSGWNLPGVMAAGGIQAFIKSQRFVPGDRFLFVGTHPLQLVVADQVVRSGGDVAGVLFAQSPWRALRLLQHPSIVWHGRDKLTQTAGILARLRRAGVPVRFRQTLVRAHGDCSLEAVSVGPTGPDGVVDPRAGETIPCDRLGICFGFLASSELVRQVGAACLWDVSRGGWIARHDEWMRTSVSGVYVAGEITGVSGAQVAAAEGRLAAIGYALHSGNIDEARAASLAGPGRRVLHYLNRFARLLSQLSWPGERCLDQWLCDENINLCKCEEVSVGAFADAMQQNPHVTTANAAKLLTRAGMGPCQGRYCQFALVRMLAAQRGMSEEDIGAFTARFPSKPLRIERLLGAGDAVD